MGAKPERSDMLPDHGFMGCQPGSCALPHPLPAPEESGCHWPYGNVFFGGIKPYRTGDPICMLTEAQHRRGTEDDPMSLVDAEMSRLKGLIRLTERERDHALAARAELAAENERLHQALCDVQFDLINCSQAAGSGACEHLQDAIAIVIRTLAPPGE